MLYHEPLLESSPTSTNHLLKQVIHHCLYSTSILRLIIAHPKRRSPVPLSPPVNNQLTSHATHPHRRQKAVNDAQDHYWYRFRNNLFWYCMGICFSIESNLITRHQAYPYPGRFQFTRQNHTHQAMAPRSGMCLVFFHRSSRRQYH